MGKKIKFEDFYYNDWLHFRAEFNVHRKLLWVILAMLLAITTGLIVVSIVR
mgnify:FL=1